MDGQISARVARVGWLACAGLLGALGACAASRAASAQRTPTERALPATTARSATLEAEPDAYGAGAPAATPADASATPIASDAVPTVTLEPSYPASALAPSDAESVRWNIGGAREPRESGSAPAYQPVPRVVVNVQWHEKRAPRRALARWLEQAQAHARDKGYWPFRRCFEAGLRETPALEGETLLLVTVSSRSRAPKVSLVDSRLKSREVTRCLSAATEQLKFSPPPLRRVELLASIHLWPGDGPPPDQPTTPAPDAPFDAASFTALIGTAAVPLSSCYREAIGRDPMLWGRLALAITLERDGSVHRIEEAESHFPDLALTRCVQSAIGRLVFVPVLGKPFVFVQPIRFGSPSGSASGAGGP